MEIVGSAGEPGSQRTSGMEERDALLLIVMKPTGRRPGDGCGTTRRSWLWSPWAANCRSVDLLAGVDADGQQGDVVLGVLPDHGLDEGVADLCRCLLRRLSGVGGGQLVDAVVEAAGVGLDQAVGVQQQQ